MKFKPYKSFFAEEKTVNKKSSLRKAIKELAQLKVKIKRIREEDDENVDKAEILSDVVDQIEDVITDVIDNLGATDPTVNTLIDTASEIENIADASEMKDEVLDDNFDEIDAVDDFDEDETV